MQFSFHTSVTKHYHHKEVKDNRKICQWPRCSSNILSSAIVDGDKHMINCTCTVECQYLPTFVFFVYIMLYKVSLIVLTCFMVHLHGLLLLKNGGKLLNLRVILLNNRFISYLVYYHHWMKTTRSSGIVMYPLKDVCINILSMFCNP